VTVKTDDHRALYNVGITMMKMGEHLKEPAKYFAQKALEFHPCEEYEEFIATFNDHLPKKHFLSVSICEIRPSFNDIDLS